MYLISYTYYVGRLNAILPDDGCFVIGPSQLANESHHRCVKVGKDENNSGFMR